MSIGFALEFHQSSVVITGILSQAEQLRANKRPNSEETIIALEKLTTRYAAQCKRFVVVAWDKAPWHTSQKVCCWIRAYNRKAKQEGLPRLLVVYHPTRSPWLMPLEPIFGWVKHQILGGQVFDTLRVDI